MSDLNPRISLIATFFNASEYLDRCVKSVIGQTHWDYEVLLVDDGSSDDTFQRLTAYADGERVRCFTKQNGGAGSARNFGVAHARGEYVSFADGDDFVSPYYLENLDLALIEQGCDMAVGVHINVAGGRERELKWGDRYRSERISAAEAALMLAYEELYETPWCKLASRALYKEIPFPERYYEDVAAAGLHFLAVGDVAYSEAPIYAYVARKGSIVHREWAPVTQLEDFVWAIDELLNPLEEKYPQCESALAYRRALECSRAHRLATCVADDCERARVLDARLIRDVRSSRPLFREDRRVSRAQKVRFALLVAAPKVYDIALGAYEHFVKFRAGELK